MIHTPYPSRWIKSSYSVAQGECVEVGVVPGAPQAFARDSKRPGARHLTFGGPSWNVFLTGITTRHRL